MNLLVISNMAPSECDPAFGLFVQNQVDELRKNDVFAQLMFIAIRSRKKGLVALLSKYGGLMLTLFARAIFNKTRFDIIHVHYFFPTIWFAIVYKLLRNPKVKIVVTFHGSDIYSYSKPSKAYRFASRFVDHYIFVSEALKQRFYKQPVATSILSAGILDSYKPVAMTRRFDLIMVGNLNVNKGLDRLLALLSRFDSPLRIAVVGDGEFAEQLNGYRSAIHQVDYFGSCSAMQIKGYLNQSRYLVNFSRNESFGLVMTEAMACGLPVIATQTDGAMAQIKVGYNGFVIENDEHNFLDSAREVIANCLNENGTYNYQSLSKNALSSAQQYKVSQVAIELGSIYQEMLS